MLSGVSALMASTRYGGMFSLLLVPSSSVRDVRGRFGSGVLSGVASWSQVASEQEDAERWCERLPRTELRRGVMNDMIFAVVVVDVGEGLADVELVVVVVENEGRCRYARCLIRAR